MIYIIRHGQTDNNKAGIMLGRSDVPLNDKGREEARAAGEYFRNLHIIIDACYSSPLSRAIETAELVTGLDRSQIIIDEHLNEMDYGPYEGANLYDPPEAIRVFFTDLVHNPAPEGMEPLPHVTARLGEFLENLPYHPGENILLSTHAIAMKGALEYLTPEFHGSYWSKYIGNCAVYAFDKTDGKYTVPEEIV